MRTAKEVREEYNKFQGLIRIAEQQIHDITLQMERDQTAADALYDEWRELVHIENCSDPNCEVCEEYGA